MLVRTKHFLGDGRAIFVVDFDGTLVEDRYPDIGPLRPGVVEFFRLVREDGHIIVLSTCREGESLVKALDSLAMYGLYVDYVNENVHELVEAWGDCRKIAGDYYLDDHNIGEWSWEDAIALVHAIRENASGPTPFFA